MFLMPCIPDTRVPPADAGAPPTLAWARLTIGIVRSDLDLSPEWLPLAALYLQAECICILKLCRSEASSILTPYHRVLMPYRRVLTLYRRVLTPYRRVLTARDYPCRWAVRIFCIAVNGAAAEAQPQLPEPIGQSATTALPRGLFRGACRSRRLRPLPFVAVGGSRPTAVQTIRAHPVKRHSRAAALR